MTREKQLIKIGFPFALYWKQLFAADTYVRYINPFGFWHRYRIDHLEVCRELNTVQYLETCRKLDWQCTKPEKKGIDQSYTDASNNSPNDRSELNTIYISQPRIKLKYRGVTYYTKDILNININAVKTDPSAVKSNSSRCTNNSNNASTPEKSGSD